MAPLATYLKCTSRGVQNVALLQTAAAGFRCIAMTERDCKTTLNVWSLRLGITWAGLFAFVSISSLVQNSVRKETTYVQLFDP
jgi:hypothetical protein